MTSVDRLFYKCKYMSNVFSDGIIICCARGGEFEGIRSL